MDEDDSRGFGSDEAPAAPARMGDVEADEAVAEIAWFEQKHGIE